MIEEESVIGEEPKKIEKEFDIDLGDEDTFFVANSGAVFGIAFNKILNPALEDAYNDFDMNSKRIFRNITPQVLDTYQEMFLDEDGKIDPERTIILFNILDVKYKILDGYLKDKMLSFDDFMAALYKVTDDCDGYLLKLIDGFISANYDISLNAQTSGLKEKKRKVNTELQFTDEHAIELLKCAYIYRILIPLISDYFSYTKLYAEKHGDTVVDEDDEDAEDSPLEESNNRIFTLLFDRFAKKPKQIKNKLYKLTYSRLCKSEFSNKGFWAVAEKLSMTPETAALDIYKKLLGNAVPKMSIKRSKNPIGFLHSVLMNQIDFLFQIKFRQKLVPISMEDGSNFNMGNEDDDDNDVSEFERMELSSSRKDEGSYVIRKKNIDDVMSHIAENMNVGVDDLEVHEAMRTLKKNQIQEGLVSMLTFRYFHDKEAVKYLTFYQYCYVVICCRKYLEAKNFQYIPKIISSNCEKHRERANIVGKKVRPDIMNSKKYKDLMNDKYPGFGDEFEQPFMSILGTIYSSVFKDGDGNEILDGTVKVAKIAEELLDVAKLI